MSTNLSRWTITALLLGLAGVAAMAAALAARRDVTRAKRYEPWLDVVAMVLLVWGIYDLWWLLTHHTEVALLRSLPASVPLAWAYHGVGWLLYLHGPVELLLGFLIFFESFAVRRGARSPEAAASADALRKRLALPKLGLGTLALLMGVAWAVLVFSLRNQ